MKTQIITLETHDDLISVRDRMSWAKTPRILLVAPKFETITLRQVDLKVLQRHAASLGAQLGLVTRTGHIRAEAEALGIPVFESTGQAQRVAWPKPRRRKWRQRPPDKTLREQRDQLPAGMEAQPWRSHPLTRTLAFTIGVLAVLAVVGVFIPRAQVILQPVSKTQTLTMAVSASPSIKSVFITGNIPAREKRVMVEGVQTIVVTGQGLVPQSKSSGTVEFRNITSGSVVIPAGTVVSAKDVRFVTTEDATVKAGNGKTVDVPIEAVEGGSSSNVDAEAITSIEGQLGLSLTVTNPEATSGGHEQASVQASDNDRAHVKDLLLETLKQNAREKFANELNSGDLLFDATLQNTQILSEKYDPPPGGVGAKLTLSMQAEYLIEYASAADLTQLAMLAMNASLPADFSPASSAVTVKPLSDPFLDADGTLRWNMGSERKIVEVFDAMSITGLVQGLGVRKAQASLDKSLPTASAPQIQLSPGWWPYVPLLPFRIEVLTK